MKVMSKKIRKNIQYALLLLCILIFWGYGIYYGQFIEENYQSVSIRIHGEGVTSRIIERALENEVMKNAKDIPAVTAWNCLAEQQVENAVLSTTAKTRLLEVCGDMKQVYPKELVNGVIPVKGDSNGCLIDKNTAYEIFRTSEVIGNILTYQEKEYYIRGIIDAQEGL
ncbi:MAG TPA: ABC transporter permease, partial [Lachnospiraceae bacterium]|nr:ABC transporter permease [Lachnospiraceae bacterium]